MPRERERHLHVQQPRCPYCHDEVPKGERPEVCSGCHALHHAECFAEHGGCSACGQDAPVRQRPSLKEAPVVQTEEEVPVCVATNCEQPVHSGTLCRVHQRLLSVYATIALLVCGAIAVIAFGLITGT